LRGAVTTAVCAAIAIACLSGCGPSKAERDAGQKAAEARFDAAAAAEWDREHSRNAAVAAEPVALPDAQQVRSVPSALRGAIRQADPGAQPGDTSQRVEAVPVQGDLRAMYQQMMGNVCNNLPRDNSVQFHETYMNRLHTAVCGSVDYELVTNGVRTRSRRQRFIGTMNDAVVDTDAPGVHATFERMAAPVDCSPDLYNYNSYSR
jgi:hypothetical protein